MTRRLFANRVVLITGASTGIGRATALAFARHGAKVAIGDVDERANETIELIEKTGGEAVFFKTDLTNGKEVKSLVEQTVKKFGGLHHAFNHATSILNIPTKFADIEEVEFNKVMEVNIKSIFLTVKHELQYMVANGGGTIVNTASLTGLMADPFIAPYVTANHAVIGLTKAAAFDYAQDGIRVNAIEPVLTEVSLTQLDVKKSFFPMPRAVKPEEIADMVIFLSSDAASFCNGTVYAVNRTNFPLTN
ncbi:NAD(P)-dependent dehydrogenase (short-subunit alcohol dehydrogenase family) [Ureibacillus xyleni]|uniref:NAD(P)-dependent dehydrogenase (Short-subunit alcohol dehydrogenase family) n=1 Tax=Ureibacillus xyleni TaxID=614648 RepID=A0A285SFE0_9BACL|nr:SDR family oxidoreductase [Ureibacillus xyleni]SOC06586.1 NAD(P)-dependent dehydrogenase (short-subunit alcohol dehydrogenase family) [Ureibacillus xyleni]